jgi:cytidylate kinase
LAAQGEQIALDVLLAEQTARDARDANRAVAPLMPAADALLVDTTGLDANAVVDRLERLVRDRLK